MQTAGFILSGLAVFGAFVPVTSARGQNVHTSRLYEQVLENIGFAREGYVLDSFGVIRINQGASAEIAVDVPAGSSVEVMGDCDQDCSDLDMGLYNANGTLLGEDRLEDFYPIVDFMSGEDGRVTIAFDMVDCEAAYCYAAYSVFIGESR